MELQVGRWGNSLAVRLPTPLARQVGLHEGSRVQANVTAARELRLVCAPTAPSAKSRAQLALELEAMHKEWPMGRSVVRWMRDQGY